MTDLNLYFDYNAAAPLRATALAKMQEVLAYPGNASSVHHHGRQLTGFLEEARQQISHCLGAKPSEVIFTSSGSEANNHIIQGFEKKGSRILVCATDHVSTLHASDQPEIIPVDSQGLVRLDILESLLQQNPSCSALVSVHLANNESGVIQPLSEIVACARRYGAFIHTDAVQALGRMPLHFKEMDVDAMTVSSSKIGGPVGAAALILSDKIKLPSLIRGGGQEKGRRAGSSNVAAIAAFGVAVQEACSENWQQVDLLKQQFENTLLTQVPHIKIYGVQVSRLPNTTLLRMPGVTSELQMISLDLATSLEGCRTRFAVSAGSACSSGKTTSSHVLKAMGVSDAEARESLRISCGPTVTSHYFHLLTQRWLDIYQQCQRSKAA